MNDKWRPPVEGWDKPPGLPPEEDEPWIVLRIEQISPHPRPGVSFLAVPMGVEPYLYAGMSIIATDLEVEDAIGMAKMLNLSNRS